MASIFTFNQSIPSSTWTIVHNLDCAPVCDIVTNIGGTIYKILPLSIKHTDLNTMLVMFDTPTAGVARLVGKYTFQQNLLQGAIDPGALTVPAPAPFNNATLAPATTQLFHMTPAKSGADLNTFIYDSVNQRLVGGVGGSSLSAAYTHYDRVKFANNYLKFTFSVGANVNPVSSTLGIFDAANSGFRLSLVQEVGTTYHMLLERLNMGVTSTVGTSSSFTLLAPSVVIVEDNGTNLIFTADSIGLDVLPTALPHVGMTSLLGSVVLTANNEEYIYTATVAGV